MQEKYFNLPFGRLLACLKLPQNGRSLQFSFGKRCEWKERSKVFILEQVVIRFSEQAQETSERCCYAPFSWRGINAYIQVESIGFLIGSFHMRGCKMELRTFIFGEWKWILHFFIPGKWFTWILVHLYGSRLWPRNLGEPAFTPCYVQSSPFVQLSSSSTKPLFISMRRGKKGQGAVTETEEASDAGKACSSR